MTARPSANRQGARNYFRFSLRAAYPPSLTTAYSHPPGVRAPAVDPLFDLLAVQIVFESLLGQRDQFIVSRKAQRDQLVFSQFMNLRMPLRRRQRVQPQPLLKPDHAILHLQRIRADQEQQYKRRQ